MQRKSWFIAISAVLVILMGVYFFTARSRGKGPAAAFTPVKVEPGPLAISVDATGSAAPIATIDLAPASLGRITALPVEPGDRVRAGQILARLDSTDARSRLRSAEDALTVAEKKLQAAEKDAILAPVQALAQVARHERRCPRPTPGLSSLKSGSTADTTEVPAAESSLTQAKLDLAIAAANAAGTGINDQLAAARAAERDARDALASAKEDAAGMVLTAPIDGVVTEVNGRVGAATPDQTPLISLANIQRLLIKATVDENDIAQVKPGQSARITLGALPDREFQGQVISVGEVGNTENEVVTFPVEVSLEDPAHLVKAGMTADVSIITADRDHVLTVPNTALETRMGRTAVRIFLSDGRTTLRRVQTGLRTETMTEITGGLRAGDRVAIAAPKAAKDATGNGTSFGLGTGVRGFNGPSGHGPGNQGKGGATD